MNKKYFAVTAKCGHVGRNNYIIKTIAIIADNAKEAAKIARWTGRVKHNDKKAIIQVINISYEEYLELVKQMNNDAYFNCKNIQEQRCYCDDINKSVYQEENKQEREELKSKRKNRVKRKMDINKFVERMCYNEIKDYSYAY